MAVTYRSEKKKILRNQLFTVKMMQYVVSHAVSAVADNVYRELVMREADGETDLDSQCSWQGRPEDKRDNSLFRRLINAPYFYFIFEMARREI